jgi:hypothetical protein
MESRIFGGFLGGIIFQTVLILEPYKCQLLLFWMNVCWLTREIRNENDNILVRWHVDT